MLAKPVFVDTNILVYAIDIDAGRKHERARACVADCWRRPRLPAVSVQVLQEFYVTLLRRKVPPGDAWGIVRPYLRWDVVENSREVFQEGCRLQERWSLSAWDAWIVAAAKHAGAGVIWSEDLQTGQKFDGIVVENPLLSV